MSKIWKDLLKDIQDHLKLLVPMKPPVFSCVYIELSQSCMSKIQIDPETSDLWKDLDRNFTPCREFHVGTPLVGKFNSPNPFRHPESGRLFPPRQKTPTLLQWYQKSSKAVPLPTPGESPQKTVRPVRAITKLHENFRLLMNAAKVIPPPLFQSIIGKETPLSHNPLDNWMNLLFAVAWQAKEGTLLRTRDIVYWPCREEEDEYEFQDWIPLDDARNLVLKSRGEKISPKTEIDALGRYFCEDLPNLFSVADDVFQSSIHLISFLLHCDFEMQKGDISRYDHDTSLKIIKYAADYAFDQPKAPRKNIVKHVQQKYPEFRLHHFDSERGRWRKGDCDYAKMLTEAIEKAKTEKHLLLGGSPNKKKKPIQLSERELSKLNREFCKDRNITLEDFEEILKAGTEETRELTSEEKKLLEQYTDFKGKWSKRTSSGKRKKTAKKTPQKL